MESAYNNYLVSLVQTSYRIYSINYPGRLFKFLDLESERLFEVGAYSNKQGTLLGETTRQKGD